MKWYISETATTLKCNLYSSAFTMHVLPFCLVVWVLLQCRHMKASENLPSILLEIETAWFAFCRKKKCSIIPGKCQTGAIAIFPVRVCAGKKILLKSPSAINEWFLYTERVRMNPTMAFQVHIVPKRFAQRLINIYCKCSQGKWTEAFLRKIPFFFSQTAIVIMFGNTHKGIITNAVWHNASVFNLAILYVSSSKILKSKLPLRSNWRYCIL